MGEPEIVCRIRVVGPLPGVTLQVQRGKAELLPPTRAVAAETVFEFPLRAGRSAGGAPNFLGPYAQGPADKRFVYVNVGTCAGQMDSCWTRRAKVPLAGITAEMVDELLAHPGAAIEARYAGVGRDGGPACATVPLLDGGWRVAK